MKKSVPVFSANLLFLITMALVVVIGSIVQSWNLSMGLIATEIFLIGLPAIGFLRREHIPIKEGLRLNPIPPLIVVLCLVLGIALFFFSLLIEGVMAQLTSLQSVPVQNDLLPKTGLDMVIYFMAFAIFAPLGEETLFRGVIQGSYESRKSAGIAITTTALMFAFYHLRLSGLPALLPIAFILSFVVWKTHSLYAGLLIHFGNNGASALQNILYFSTGQGFSFISLWSALAGLIVTIAILILIWRMNATPEIEKPAQVIAPAPPTTAKPWLAAYWPLILAGVVYIGVTGATLAASLPKLAPSKDYSFGMPVLTKPVTTNYEITNKGGQIVGEMSCTLSPGETALQLNCSRSIQAFEYQSGNSYYQDGTHLDILSAAWDSQTMDLLSFSLSQKYDNGISFDAAVNDGELVTNNGTETRKITLESKSLAEFEWAWHAALLKANSGQAFSVPFAYLTWYDPASKSSSPIQKTEMMRVYDDEIMNLPSGDVTVRKITLANYSAWYAREDALAGIPRPVSFDDRMFVYTIKG